MDAEKLNPPLFRSRLRSMSMGRARLSVVTRWCRIPGRGDASLPARVLKPGGEIIPLSRVSADSGLRQVIEHLLAPIVHRLGCAASEFAWSRYAEWVKRPLGMELVERFSCAAVRPFLADPLSQDYASNLGTTIDDALRATLYDTIMSSHARTIEPM